MCCFIVRPAGTTSAASNRLLPRRRLPVLTIVPIAPLVRVAKTDSLGKRMANKQRPPTHLRNMRYVFNTTSSTSNQVTTMPELTTELAVFVVCVGLFTLAAAISDMRTRRIPNKLTVPAFFAGLVFQGVFNGGPGLLDALYGFGIGFGLLFVLWIIGGGGGGDVKLMGALAVWLGFDLTLRVLIGSTVLVVAGTGAVMLWSICTKGKGKTKKKYIATGKPIKKGKKPKAETVKERQERRIMAYAIPVAVATWGVLIWQLPKL
jgi:prepilin peptidase CpaA